MYTVRCTLLAATLAASAWAQNVISAKAGLVHYTEGDVRIEGKAAEARITEFPEVKEGQVLETGEGRVEILLTPGVFLRLGENSSIRMLSSKLSDTRVEVLSGDALVEATEILEGNAVTLITGSNSLRILKGGLYRVNLAADPARIRVYGGEARLAAGDLNQVLKRAQEVQLTAVPLVTKFDTKAGDPLYRWASRRSERIAYTNVASARSAQRSGVASSFNNGGWDRWYFNPWFGMFTFIPAGRGYVISPFGTYFYSPYYAYSYLFRPSIVATNPGMGGGGGGLSYNSGLGYNTGSRGAVISGGGASAGAAIGGGSGAGRGSIGGGGAGRGSSSGGGRGN